MIRLTVCDETGTQQHSSFVDDEVTVGRSTACNLRLTGTGVSGQHCKLVRIGNDVWLEDLGSTNGTFLNRRKVAGRVRLAGTEEIVVASYRLLVHLTPPSDRLRARSPAEDPNDDAAAWVREWEQIDAVARTWASAGERSERLLRGRKLGSARRWLAQHRVMRRRSSAALPEPKPLHRRLIAASERRHRLRWGLGLGAALVVVVVGALMAWRATRSEPEGAAEDPDSGPSHAAMPSRDASRSEARSFSEAAADQAQALFDRDPALATVLAAEGVRRLAEATLGGDRGSSAHRALRRGIETLRGVPLYGHSAAVTSVALTPEGRFAITASLDRSARIWDLDRPGRIASVALRAHSEPVRALAVLGTGRWLVTGGDDAFLVRWDLHHPDPATTATMLGAPPSGISQMVASSDGLRLVGGSSDGSVSLWDLAIDPPTFAILGRHERAVLALDAGPDGSRFVSGSDDGTAMVWQLATADTPTSHRKFSGHAGAVHAVALAGDGQWLLTGGDDGTARLWPAAGRGGPTILAGHTEPVRAVVFSRDSGLAFTAGDDDRIMVWDLDADHPELSAVTFDQHTDDVLDLVALGPANGVGRRMLVSASADGTVRTWNVDAKDREQDSVALVGHLGRVSALAASPRGDAVVSAGSDATARLWPVGEVASEGACAVGRDHQSEVLALSVAAAGSTLVSGGADGTMRIWAARADRLDAIAVGGGWHGRVRAVSTTQDGRYVAAAGDGGEIRLWDGSAGDWTQPPVVLSGHTADVNNVAFDASGAVLVSVSADRTARVWSVADPAEVTVLGHPDEVNDLRFAAPGLVVTAGIRQAFVFDLAHLDAPPEVLGGHELDLVAVSTSPSGRWVATSSSDPLVILWDFKHAREGVKLPRHHASPVDAIAFDAEDRWMATGGRDHQIRLWDLTSADPQERSLGWVGHDQRVAALVFLADGWLASASYDQTIRLWDLRSADADAIERSGLTLAGHDALVTALAIGPGGRGLVSASYDATVRFWPLDSRDLVDLGCRRAGASLTRDQWQEYLPGAYDPGCRAAVADRRK